MNRLLEDGILHEMDLGANFAYTLDDNNVFLSTEYKVLQSQRNRYFIKCMKMFFNGKIQLLYLTKSLKPFASMFSSLDPESFLTIVGNTITNVIDIKHNGFLSCQNIDIAFDKIYVDPSTLKVYLVYIPTSKRIYENITTFENELRTSLVKLITGISSLASPKTMQLVSDLSNGLLSIEDLVSRIKGGTGELKNNSSDVERQNAAGIKIVAMNAPSRFELVISKDAFVIGKNAASVDGVISFNKMISRVHCKIERVGTTYTITDLQSANGTYVNRARLAPSQPHPIKLGDIIRLANSDFQVSSI